jgi:hypothetical protein
MMHFLLSFPFLLFLLSACIGSVTQISPSPEMFASVENPQDQPTEIQTTVESIEEEVIQFTPSSTPDLISGTKEDDIQFQAHGLLPAFMGDLEVQRNLAFYDIEVEVNLDPSHVHARMEGTAHITYINRSDHPLNELVLMLWPNDKQYNADMVAGPIRIGDCEVDFQSESNGVVLRIPFEKELRPTESIEVSLPFKIESNGSIRDQRKRFGITNGVFIAPTF